MTKSGTVTRVQEERVSKGSTTPIILRGGASGFPQFWDLLHACTQYEKQQ